MNARYLAAMDRHNEVGHPEGYDGPCWGPTLADYAFVDAEKRPAEQPTGTVERDEKLRSFDDEHDGSVLRAVQTETVRAEWMGNSGAAEQPTETG